ncbi:RDD family protein [Gilvimarinus agarilyticus]|uniref:RDD family protein n=1 Tax=Gilvimarinus agarilyticus TaxID=679259 RepID=UPI000697D939|nr:RDD family protein [Gilvimarinus agarilyticus]
MPTPANAASQTLPAPEYVGFGTRLGACIIDSLLVLPLLIGAIVFAYRHMDSGLDMLLAGGDDAWVNYGIPAVFTLVFWLIKAATPGKLLLRAYIVDATSLAKPAPWQLLVRYLGYYLSLLPLGLGFLWILWDPRKQGWHDKLARTLVIRTKP